MEYVAVTQTNKDTILELFNKRVDDEGFIVEKKTGKRLVCPYTNEIIHKDDFSIVPGSAIFVNNVSYAFTEHIANQMLGG